MDEHSAGHSSSAEEALLDLIAAGRREAGRCPFVLGLCGAQGSGKSTLAVAIQARLSAEGATVAILSLDDLYLSRAERQRRAATIHPLLATRGVPGTHDVELGIALLDRLGRATRTILPRFDKSTDDLACREDWQSVDGPVEVVLLEGWCVGAIPQAMPALIEPINALESNDDPDGRWRNFVNAMLGGSYERLFAKIDCLALLAAPDFGVVKRWRAQQEQALRVSLMARSLPIGETLSDASIKRFVEHFERLTRHIMIEMRDRADLVIELDSSRQTTRIIVSDPY